MSDKIREELNEFSKEAHTSKRIVRVADKFYELVSDPNGSKVWVFRDRKALRDDKINVEDVPKYYGFTVDHNFTDYKESIDGWLNLSTAIEWKPKQGKYDTIQALFKHIFDEQIEYAFDRYSLLIKKPKQLQPILVLVSKEQGTGKTTLLNFDNLLFGTNAVILNVSQYSQEFNSLYASKLLIGIDETIIKQDFIKERLKQDSTASSIQLRKMHQEHTSLPFYGKFTLCTNKETDFAQLDDEDMRFWVRKVNKLKGFDPDFMAKIKSEIPAFLYFLLNREMKVKTALSRMWFSPEQLQTDALIAVRVESKSECAKSIVIYLEEKLAERESDEIKFSATDLCYALNNKYALNTLVKALRGELGLYNKDERYVNFHETPCRGRVYTYTKATIRY